MKQFIIFSFILFLFAFGSFSFVLASNDKSFEVNTLIIKSVVKKSESIINPVSILSYKDQYFNLAYSSEGNFIFLDKEKFFIGEDKGDSFNIISRSEGFSEGVYSGKLIVEGADNSVIMPVILEVESPILNFDVSSNIAPNFIQLSPGDYSNVELIIYNLNSKRGRVSLQYGIKNLEGKIIASEEQIIDVKDKIQLTKNLLIPENAYEGDYVFYASAVDVESGNVGTSSSLFSISNQVLTSPKSADTSNKYLFFASFIISVLILSFLIINYYWNRRLISNSNEWNQKLVDVKKVKFGSIGKEIRKLENKLDLLKEAYGKGYIKKASFEEAKIKISALISKLKKRL